MRSIRAGYHGRESGVMECADRFGQKQRVLTRGRLKRLKNSHWRVVFGGDNEETLD